MVLPVTVMQCGWRRPASSSAFITTATPPISSTLSITYLPNGLRLPMRGTCADTGMSTVAQTSSTDGSGLTLALISL